MQDPSELKGLALQIAAQLPNDRQAATMVLEFVREVIEWRAEAPAQKTALRLQVDNEQAPSAEPFAIRF